jgi:hypothetical protein
MQSLIPFVFALFSVSYSTTAYPQTLHYISAAETADVQTPLEFTANQKAFDSYITTVAGSAQLQLDRIDVSGANFNCKTISDKIQGLKPDPANDIVIFYYSGHGESPKQNAFDASGSTFPKLLCGQTSQDDMPSLDQIKGQLSSTGARLIIVGADTCNDFAGEGAVAEKNRVQFELKDLSKVMLRDYKGSVVISSSNTGEFSFYKQHSAGYFTTQFIDALSAFSSAAPKDVWADVLQKATSVIDIPRHQQQPGESPMQKQQHPILANQLVYAPAPK